MPWESLANQHILGIAPYEPGKPIEELERELGIHDAIKLASNENPLPPSGSVQRAVADALHQLNRYPDGSGYYLPPGTGPSPQGLRRSHRPRQRLQRADRAARAGLHAPAATRR